MRYNKSKLNAMRFLLAQYKGEGLEIRNKIIRMREFRTDAAQRLYKNPFLTGEREIYVLSKLCEWADVVFPENWEFYATPDGIIELYKAITREPYTKAVDTGYKDRRVKLQQCKNEFLSNVEED